ncbi:DNA-binding transcriptional regulator, PucR family [Cryptosporangium aurantiacum]|uniref:DNA-binding transcriptional regulator, PucR family n=1 Tax=Cryptosporangium aurantiacum TaxID=134849 RepID=A0A1M7RBG9_9ACTN|nr:DNA-binding transcriptional regulator, PucR family [Cryptosporangium aurantiacum]
MSWPTPSPRVRELIRRGAELALHPPDAWVEELYAAALGGERMRAIAEDPVLSEGARRTNVANVLHWATANLQRPGERVPANVTPEILEIARDLVRRGLDERSLDSYRTAQNVAWRHWMDICFGLTDDAAELRELLDVSSRSIATFLDDTVTALTVRMQAERSELTRGTHAERRAAVTLLLEGAPIRRGRAEEQLGYRLGGPHVAAIVWSSTGTPISELEDTAEAVRKAGGAERRLTVLAGTGTVWIWLPTADAPTTEALQACLPGSSPDVRVAVGRPGRDLEGFRRSHLDALTTQRMLARLTSPRRIARFEDVQLVAALTADPTQADEFVADTLGALATAEPELRDTLLTYLREQCNSSRTAERLFTHRNTVLRRLARADDLLPRPLAQNTTAVAAALEVLHWRGRPG